MLIYLKSEEIESSFDQIGQKLSYLLFKDSNSRVIFFFFICQLIKWTFSSKIPKILMDLDCLSQNVSISSLRNNQKSGNTCVFCKYYYFSLRKLWSTSGGRSKLKLTHFPINNHDPSKNLKIFELKIITLLFEFLKNNWRNINLIWTNEVPISSQEYRLSEYLQLFHVY